MCLPSFFRFIRWTTILVEISWYDFKAPGRLAGRFWCTGENFRDWWRYNHWSWYVLVTEPPYLKDVIAKDFFSRYVLVSDLTSILWHIYVLPLFLHFPAVFWLKEKLPTAKFAPVESLRSWVCHCWCCWTFIVPTGCMPLGEPRWTENLKKKNIPETGSSHLKMDGWNTSFLLGWPIFRCELLVLGSVVQWATKSMLSATTWRFWFVGWVFATRYWVLKKCGPPSKSSKNMKKSVVFFFVRLKLDDGFETSFIFIGGEDSHFDVHIFKMGWFNHQPGNVSPFFFMAFGSMGPRTRCRKRSSRRISTREPRCWMEEFSWSWRILQYIYIYSPDLYSIYDKCKRCTHLDVWVVSLVVPGGLFQIKDEWDVVGGDDALSDLSENPQSPAAYLNVFLLPHIVNMKHV